jgi:hypothetical protein
MSIGIAAACGTRLRFGTEYRLPVRDEMDVTATVEVVSKNNSEQFNKYWGWLLLAKYGRTCHD